MDILIEKLILFLIVFTIIYLCYYIFVIRANDKLEKKKKKGKKKNQERVEIQFLINKYNIDMNKIDRNQLLWDIAFVNSFIMSLTVVIIGLDIIDGYIWQLLLGVVILIPLILFGYWLLGKKYRKLERRGK